MKGCHKKTCIPGPCVIGGLQVMAKWQAHSKTVDILVCLSRENHPEMKGKSRNATAETFLGCTDEAIDVMKMSVNFTGSNKYFENKFYSHCRDIYKLFDVRILLLHSPSQSDSVVRDH